MQTIHPFDATKLSPYQQQSQCLSEVESVWSNEITGLAFHPSTLYTLPIFAENTLHNKIIYINR